MPHYLYDFTSRVIEQSVFEDVPGIGLVIPANGLILDDELKEKEGYVWVYRDNEVSQVKDTRGIYYSTETQEMVIVNNFDSIPKTLTKLQPSSIYDEWDGKKWVKNDEAEFKAKIPFALSRFQAMTVLRLAKTAAGDKTLYQVTNDYIQSLPDDSIENITAKTAWETAQEFRRDSALISMAQRLFDLTDKQVDEMFIQGSGVVA